MIPSRFELLCSTLGCLDNYKVQEALEFASQGIKHYPDDVEFYRLRGVAYETLGQIANAVEDISSAIKLLPSNDSFYSYRSHLNMRLQNYAQAIADITTAIELSPMPANYFQRSVLWYEQGNFSNALNDLHFIVATKNDSHTRSAYELIEIINSARNS
jgi:tetratricopeptide (TPR) repeat protein